MSDLTFVRLGVPSFLADVLAARGITTPTPIQAATLPDSLAGRDVLGRGRTGSGKSYAFLLPIVARLQAGSSKRVVGRPRALVLAPTRELASQLAEAAAPLAAAAGLRVLTVFGGVGAGPQIRGLQGGVDILIACPGRLQDLINQGACRLDAVEITVLDEADHMSDLGFLPGVRRLMDTTPRVGQRMLFSATLDGGVKVIVDRYLSNPVRHEIDSAQSPVSTMDHHVFHVKSLDRIAVVADLSAAPGRTVVFTRTKHGAKKLTKQLNAEGVTAVELHGNLGQSARQRNLEAFQSGKAATLVATDIAARGIHVDDVALVVHADPPVEHKAYLHRAGRTARAGNSGTVVTLMTDEQVTDVRALTKAAGIRPTITRVAPGHPAMQQVAPGDRSFVAGGYVSEASVSSANGGGGTAGGRSRGGSRRGGGSGSPTPAGGPAQSRGGSGQSGGRGRGSRPAAAANQGGRTGGSRPAAAANPRTRTGTAARTTASSGGSGRGGAVVYSTSSSSRGAAAFSASTSAGRRRGR